MYKSCKIYIRVWNNNRGIFFKVWFKNHSNYFSGSIYCKLYLKKGNKITSNNIFLPLNVLLSLKFHDFFQKKAITSFKIVIDFRHRFFMIMIYYNEFFGHSSWQNTKICFRKFPIKFWNCKNSIGIILTKVCVETVQK